jgi:2-dehydro-3-deoxyphosphooctonate aldolase (KDO 8-P synthase)
MLDISEKNQDPKFLFAGPCVIEDIETCIKIAREVKRVALSNNFIPVFKASFDKANRTSYDAYRGVGLESGIFILNEVRKNIGIPVITDVHEPNQVEKLSSLDYIQIPAFLCRQTDLIKECALSGLPTLVKKGQFLSPESCRFIEEKFYKYGGSKLFIGERGNSFGYGNLIVDATSISRLKKSCKNSFVIMDCTHSLQIPNGGEFTGGSSDMILDMVKFASVMNSDGIFIETHPLPSSSPSDSQNILELSKLEEILSISKKIYSL